MITQPSELLMALIESGKISRETICIAGNISENLICDYGFTSTQLSRLLNIDLEIIEDILHSKEVSLDEKYRLAVKEAYLFYVLKREK